MNAQDRYDKFTEGCEPLEPIEALRFFCALAISGPDSGQDWLDIEKFFDAVEAELSATKQKLEAAEARIKASQEQNAELTRKLAEQRAILVNISNGLQEIQEAEFGEDADEAARSMQRLIETTDGTELTKLLAEAKSNAVPEGWQLVPKELTDSIGRALMHQYHSPVVSFMYSERWAEILAAAKQPETDIDKAQR